MNPNIYLDNTVLDALVALEDVRHNQTLFVTDKEEHFVGVLTDGDIRRYLIAGGQLQDTVEKAVHRGAITVRSDDPMLLMKLKEYRHAKIKSVPCVDQEGHILKVFDLVNYKSHLPIDAVLMAGGKGERLRPLTEKTPKPLIKVGDKCIIDYNIDRLIEYGVVHISVTVNYLKEQIEEHFKEPRNGVQVKTVREPKFLGTIGSIRFVEEFKNDTILVMNSDLFTNINFEDFYLHFKEHDAMMSVASIPYNVSIPLGILDLDGRNVKGLIEKPKYNYYANGGIYLIKKEALQYIPEDVMFHSTDLIEALIAAGKTVIRYPLNGTWIDIGQHADLAKAQDLVKHLK
ncbi:MAG: nucleotidyltransferase family protein [Acetivibrionales bacterium]|jgi:dTDP-glucose pyrophosphorylase